MHNASPPFKLALAALFLDAQPLSVPEIMRMMQAEYGGLRFFESSYVFNCLQGLKAVGIVKIAEGSSAHEARYELTCHGKEKVKHNSVDD